MQIVFLARTFVRGQGVIGDVGLIRRQQSDHADESRKRADRISAAAEPKKKYGVAVVIVLGEKRIGVENVTVQTGACRQSKDAFLVIFQPCPRIVGANRADAGIVVDALVGVLLGNAKQLEDIR